jgi:hypothetical protein
MTDYHKRTTAFFDWVNRLIGANDDFSAVTNELPSVDGGGHGGDKPKATMVFDHCPDDVVDAINDGHVRLDDARTVDDSAPFYTGEEPKACLDVSPTDTFSRPEDHGFVPVDA